MTSSHWYFGTEPLFVTAIDSSLQVQVHRQPPRRAATPACLSRALNVHVHTGRDLRVSGSIGGHAFDEIFTRGRAFIAPPRSQTVLDWRDEPYEFVRVRIAERALEPLASSLGLRLPHHVAINRHDPLLVEAATGLARAGATGGDPAYCRLLGDVVAYQVLLGEVAGGEEATPAAFPARTRQRLYNYVEAHLDERLPLNELAALVGLGPHHFLRRFHATFGTTPHDYVISKRVERARDLLGDETLTIADVAQQAGFAHQGHLSRLFRRQTGQTPRDYRKNL